MLSRLRKKRAYRAAAGGTILPLVMTLVVTGPAVRPAEAQLQIKRVAIIDFAVAPGLDDVLGRKAADGIAVELSARDDYEIIPRDEVRAAIVKTLGREDRQLTPVSIIALGKVLEVQSIIMGRVDMRRVSVSPASAMIMLSALEYDTSAGDPVNGARVTGESSKKMGAIDPAILVDEALNTAVSRAIRAMADNQLPEAMVLISARDGTVIINKGSRDGFVVGMRMIATRNVWNPEKEVNERRKVGELIITEVEADQSIGRVTLPIKGVQTDDRVRVRYELPPLPSTTTIARREPQPQRKNAFRAFVLPLLTVLGLSAIASFGGGSAGSATDAPKGLNASAGSDGGTVLISFETPRDISRADILAFLIFRSTTPNFAANNATIIDIVPGPVGSYIDTASTFTKTFDLDVDEDTGEVTTDTQFDPNPGTGQVNNNLAFEQFATTFSFEADHSPLVNGLSYYYSVVRVTKVPPEPTPPASGNTGGGTGGGGGGGQANTQGYRMFISLPSNPVGPVTPLTPPTLISPPNIPNAGSDTVDLSNVTFEWQATAGATNYIVQVSPDISFNINNRWQSDRDEGVQIVTTQAAGTTISRTFITLDDRFPSVTPQTLFWRVGALNSRDPSPPKSNSVNDSGYVFSQAFAFSTLETPPLPPPSAIRSPLGPRFQRPANPVGPAWKPGKPKKKGTR